ncbi:hypothetical protein [Parapusillimonas granuli]|uniref:Lactonase family protein n=1 Tax=Parapusillimonas granuli TaxID=380911 RepID=A0A853G5Q6_9BURK|nr:hypothetical protein [Parapusillimonas granuli]MBB5216850.1 DNA-binding beta-propeller fold protein YncE [Parapusillimonas granuli]MEB2401496.1 hypothetical protein [Alcaligenaceae bacterium]NYT51649.1 hypothetical protein [Parapusillimonas granuli]
MKKVAIALIAIASAATLVGCSDGGGGSSGNAAVPSEDSPTYFYGPKNLAVHKIAGAPDALLRILNENDTLTTCASNGMGELSNCGIDELDGADVVHQMVVNPRTGSVYFLQDSTDSVLVCDGARGALSSCKPSTGGGAFKDPSSLALNDTGTVAYATNEDDTLTVCQVLGDGGFSSCTVTDVNGALDTPVQVGLASGDYGTHAFFLNGETKSMITGCTLAPGGMPSACQAQSNELFTAPATMAFSPNGKYAYIGNVDDSIVACRIGNDASLSACVATEAGEQEIFAGIQKIAVDADGTNLYAVSARNSRVTHCKLKNGGAELSDCNPYSIEGFMLTTDLALNENLGSASLFLTSLYNDTVYGCALEPNGGFGESCVGTRFMEQ